MSSRKNGGNVPRQRIATASPDGGARLDRNTNGGSEARSATADGNVPLRNVAPASPGGLDRESRSDNGAPRNTEADVRLSRFQRFRVARVSRAMLKEAPYNPRVMDEHGHKLLNRSLKKSGLVETIVWNKRTGNVVGGHQRLSELDKLEGSKEYALDVAVIDVDETEEREINIKLNNQNMMGAYDTEKLAALFIQDGVQFADTGFSALDIELNFDTPVANAILGTDRDNAASAAPPPAPGSDPGAESAAPEAPATAAP